MTVSDFQIGDRCIFQFSGEKFYVEVMGVYPYNKNCLWVSPEEEDIKVPYAREDVIHGRYSFGSSIDYLTLVEHHAEEDIQECDISTLL